jgi:hypothetical protein
VLNEDKDAVDGPVGEPLDVVAGRGGLEGAEGKVGGEGDADEVGEEAGGDVEEDEDGKDGGAAEDGVGLGHLGLALQVDQGRVLGELFRIRLPTGRLATGADLLVDLSEVVWAIGS